MRVLGKFQPSRTRPHPTPLRGATFSREREKGVALEARAEKRENRPYVPRK